MDAQQQQEIEQKLQALRDAYAIQLPAKLTEIDSLWEELQGKGWNPEQARILHRLIHTMTGSAPTFGFTRLGTESRNAENLLKSWLDSGQLPNREQYDTLNGIIRGFPQHAKQAENNKDNQAAHDTQEKQQTGGVSIYLLEKNHSLSDTLQHQLQQFDYQPSSFCSVETISEAIKTHTPAAIIIDADHDYSGIPGRSLCSQFDNNSDTPIPVFQVSSDSSFTSRMEAVRNGCLGLFVKPVDSGQITDNLDKHTQAHEHEPYRVLVVDDDPVLAAHIQLVLQHAGMDVYTITDPHLILDIMSDTRPEIILMDLYMPGCLGPEVATLIRQIDTYVSTPIVYLSSEADMDKQYEAMRVGGDDFLTKPIDDKHLISSISIRAERYRLLNSMMIQDSLTGLLKHTKIKEQLAVEISRAHRTKTPLSFAMIDIDHFKSVNDNYGHISGDRVIKSLARLLQQRLRKSDSIGRYGGEEFAVVLPTCSIEYAESVLDEIRHDFSQLVFTADGQEFFSSISIGIASLEHFHTAEAINKAADEALYIAKHTGRNKIAIASPDHAGSLQTGTI